MSAIEPALAFTAGVLTVASPCVLPVLPIIVGSAIVADRRGPLALAAGLIVSFATLGALLAFTASWLGPLATWLRWFAIGCLLLFGVMTAFPTIGSRIGARTGLANYARLPRRGGLLGSFLIGLQLGLVWSPCAGPILAGILTLAAVDHQPAQSFVLLVEYGAGASLPMMALAYGGRFFSRAFASAQKYTERLQRIGGTLVIAAAVLILLGWDSRIEDALLPYFPKLR